MKTRLPLTVAVAVLVAAKFSTVPAATLYVSPASRNPTPPYTNWSAAAVTIQDAVDAAVPGDEIVVTNGIYATGGRAVGTNLLANRVAVDKPLTLRSVNGPEFTIIQGYQVPGTTNGDGAIRCVYLADGASLSGFTLTNGATVVPSSWELAESEFCGGGVWCASTNATLTNCRIVGNLADYQGGGACGGTLQYCTLTGNSTHGSGGGAAGTGNNPCTLHYCMLAGNSGGWGAGAFDCVLYNSTLTGNSADGLGGGGACGCTLHNCTLTGNSAHGSGGGAEFGTLYNCTLTGNSAGSGGGAYGGTLYNCTLTDNSAERGGGVAGGGWGYGDIAESRLYNCIVCFNRAPNGANYSADWTTLAYSCTTPMPTNGVGNITNDPAFVDAAAGNYRLRPGSPCIDAGTNLSAIITDDLDGRPRPVDGNGDGLAAFDIGAYEYRALLVWQDSPSPAPPYGTWATAATKIQDAVDAALAGDEIVVTNGTYATGGRTVGTNLLANRVAVDKPLTLRSVNGPQFTIIQGAKAPGGGNGDGAIRCVYLTDGASLSGFTLTNGATRALLDGTTYGEPSGGGVFCGLSNVVVSNCVIVGNSADYGGGVAGGTLFDCRLTANSAESLGGGAYWSTLDSCAVSGNSAGYGGGTWYSTLFQCGVTDNSTAYDGGGADRGTLYNCTLTGNSAHGQGGGADRGTLYNCILTGNSAESGGGAAGSTLYNSTVTGNSAERSGGVAAGVGAYANIIESRLYNCIVCFNRAPKGANYSAEGTTLAYSCTTPLPPGPGNIAADPQLASATHLSPNSPCIGAGNPAYASGVDIDGEPWASPPAMGADQPGPATGPLSLWIDTSFTNVATGYVASFTAWDAGSIRRSVWDFGDGTMLTNQAFASHAWSAPGLYTVRLTGYNDSHPAGVMTSVAVTVSAAVYYVNAASTNPVFPYASWETAARAIQDAIGAATLPGRLVLVTNGVYRVGTLETNGWNRVALMNEVAVRSVHGSEVTVVEGETNGVRCAYVGRGSLLSGFTLTKGTAAGDLPRWLGGGVWCEPSGVVTNCVLIGNSALAAGGAFGGTLYNCTLNGNTADYGGGAYEATLNNCTLTGNSATNLGGGAGYSTLNNCIVYSNNSTNGANYYDSTLNYCCTTPMPTNGLGNITNAPLFVDYAGGNLRLQANSPCINAGRNAYAPGSTDLDGNPRVVSGTVDIGAYEFQGPGSMVSYAWLQQYGLPTDGSADFADLDADGQDNWQEWRCGTAPTNALSVLRLLSALPDGTKVTVSWQSVAGVSYFLERSTDLSAIPPFSLLATNIPGQAGTTSYTDTNAAGMAPLFYRVGVGN